MLLIGSQQQGHRARRRLRALISFKFDTVSSSGTCYAFKSHFLVIEFQPGAHAKPIGIELPS